MNSPNKPKSFLQKILDIFNKNDRNTVNKETKIDLIHNNQPPKINIDNSTYVIPKELYNYYDGTVQKRKEEILARDILSTVNVCFSSHLCLEAQKYLSTPHSRIEICAYAAELCIPPCNNNELYLIYSAYLYAGAKYRKQAIFWLEKYIENGAVSDYVESYTFNFENYSYDQRIKFVSFAHANLADLYAKEGLFADSNRECLIAISIAPFLVSNYAKLAHNYIKQKDFDNAKTILKKAQHSIWYTLDEEFKKNLDTIMAKFNEQIAFYEYFLSDVIPSILEIIKNNPGILQKDLYASFPNIDPRYIRWTCKNLSKEEKIIRNKKGNSYTLYVSNNFMNS